MSGRDRTAVGQMKDRNSSYLPVELGDNQGAKEAAEGTERLQSGCESEQTSWRQCLGCRVGRVSGYEWVLCGGSPSFCYCFVLSVN